MKTLVREAIRQMPLFRNIFRERDHLRHERALLWAPPGHFYSPIPSPEERAQADLLRDQPLPRELPGIDLNEAGQLELFERFAASYAELPWGENPKPGLRYYFENPSYSYSDAICLYSMIRHARPKRIIEVGSGFSSCVMLDTNEGFFGNGIDLTFIEPYPQLLFKLTTEADRQRVRVLPKKLQEVPVAEFQKLEAGDILFIDSTHVAKAFSDVNYAFATILPALAAGVHIHVHDVFYPFEYPAPWLKEGRAWNELYLLRAFLQYNERFRIVFFNTFLEHFHWEKFTQRMPLCLKNPGGSIWLQRV
jgi:predicted O-methyltransferase YrrM